VTVPKLRTISRGGSRYYIHPESREKAVSVTSVVGMLPKPFLQYWAAKVVAETAVARIGSVVDMVIGGDHKGAVDFLKRAPGRDTGRAADMGNTVHELCEQVAKGQTVGRLHPEVAAYVNGFRGLCDALEPEFLHTESTVWNHALGVSGTFDWSAHIDAGKLDPERRGERLHIIGDNKTTRSGVHAEVALQLAAYALPGNRVFVPAASGDWTEEPLPHVDGAMVFHLRPDAARAVPVAIHAALPHPFLEDDAEGGPLRVTLGEVFRALVLVHFWDRDLSTTVLRPDVVTITPDA
jgi:hypothetical protein